LLPDDEVDWQPLLLHLILVSVHFMSLFYIYVFHCGCLFILCACTCT